MGLFITTTATNGKEKIEVDIGELTLRLKSLADGCNIEVIQLAISSILDEIDDAVGNEKE